jgi:hypothetical protein
MQQYTCYSMQNIDYLFVMLVHKLIHILISLYMYYYISSFLYLDKINRIFC